MEHRSGTATPESQPVTLTREQISVRLREVALFQGLGQDDLTEILRISEAVRIDGGEYVFEEGERGDHFFVIVHGNVELRKATGTGFKKLAILRPGQAFGEMALLNQTPRSASALATEDTYLLSVSRAAFSRMLGGDTLSVRLLKNLSKALWATSVRLASQQTRPAEPDGQETLAEFNRLLRARLLPRVTPRVSGYDIAAATLAPRQGSGSTAWDWFVLTDGRPAFVVTKATKGDVFSAQRLAAIRMLLRSAAAEPHRDLGAMLTKVARSLRAGWVEGLSGSVMVGLVALADGAAEWVEAGPVTGVLVRRRGDAEELRSLQPAIGDDVDRPYESSMIVLARDDRIVAITNAYSDPVGVVAPILDPSRPMSAKDALSGLLEGLPAVHTDATGGADVSAAVITRAAVGGPES